MLNHKRSHPEVVDEDRKFNLIPSYEARPQEQAHKLVENAARALDSDPEPDDYKFCFAPNGRHSKKENQLFDCF